MSAPTDRDHSVLQAGRELISYWMGLLRAVHLYDTANDTVTTTAGKVREKVAEIARGSAGEVHVAVRQDAIYIAGERIREATIGSSVYHSFIDLLRMARLRGLRIDEEVTVRELENFARLLADLLSGRRSAEEMASEMKVRGVQHLELEALEGEDELVEDVDEEQVARRIYLRSIGAVKTVFDNMRKTDQINSRRVKRVVQQMIESLNRDPSYLLNLTSLKNYDEYTFNHSVNVAVMAIALARHVGLARRQLYVIGQAGMLHDLGKLCIPKELLNKPGALTKEEWSTVKSHPVEGFVSTAHRLGINAELIDVPLVAYEHHMNLSGGGYPAGPTANAAGLMSRIVAIVDRYDAMTSARVFRRSPIPPPKALAIMYHSGDHDAALLRYFMNLMGFFPLGSVVRLSDGSTGIVVGTTSESELRHFPTVKLVVRPDGSPDSGRVVDLAKGAHERAPLRVAETLEASEHSIEVMEHLL